MKILGYEIKRVKKEKATSKSFSSSPSIPYSLSSYITNGQPFWRNLAEANDLIKCYYENPVVNSIINIRAEAKSKAKLYVKDLNTGELTLLEEYSDKNLKKLFTKPNPLQKTGEWIIQDSVFFDVLGDSYLYATAPEGFNFDYKSATTLKNLPAYNITPVITGRWLEATELSDVIVEYRYVQNAKEIPIPTERILHQNTVNIVLDVNFTQGRSKLLALKKPISNIDISYESRNVIGKNRGALGLISSDSKDDALGSVPFNDSEKEEIQKEFQDYGLMEGQYSHIISRYPLKYQDMTKTTKDLMLFEEVSHSAMPICHSYNVPIELVRNWIKTGTLGADNDVALKQFYDNTIITEVENRFKAINTWLKIEEHGIEVVPSFDHLKVLQADRKKEAETDKTNYEVSELKFFSGLITYGQFAAETNTDLEDSSLEKLRIFDLTEDQRAALGLKNSNNKTEAA